MINNELQPGIFRKVILSSAIVSFLCGVLGGCGTGSSTRLQGTKTTGLHGKMSGGQQPIYNASIYLYAAGNTGYGSAFPYAGGAASLLGSHVVMTDTAGNFDITGDYSCPSASTEIYLEGVGGTPDAALADSNANITMLAALGPCGNLSTLKFITMNELTTVASAYALAPFMDGAVEHWDERLKSSWTDERVCLSQYAGERAIWADQHGLASSGRQHSGE